MIDQFGKPVPIEQFDALLEQLPAPGDGALR